MIRRHDFNSRWWAGEAGIVDDIPAFLAATDAERDAALRAFAWVELRAPLDAVPLEALARSGFFQVDAQLPFRLGCGRVAATPSLDALTIEQASRTPFRVDVAELAPFAHERFRHVPNVDEARLADRYAMWANEQIARAPEWCLRISANGAVQGWFLSEMTAEGLNLALAMLHRNASISGMYLYQKSIVEYARLGARVGHARFSVENVAVLNIYSRLGAQFLAPVGVWFWIAR